MSQLRCPTCSAMCANEATSCGNCGHPVRPQSRTKIPVVSAKSDMTVKGTAYLGRKRTLESKFGSANVEAMISEIARDHSVFAQPVLASTPIPVDQWIAFNDELIARFYGGFTRTYWHFGQESAEFALTGPYKNLVRDRDANAYAQAVSTAWKVYYSHGRADGQWEDDVFRYRIEDVPVHHVYFEYTACGWVERGLKLIGLDVTRSLAVAGYSRGDTRVEYHFYCRRSSRR